MLALTCGQPTQISLFNPPDHRCKFWGRGRSRGGSTYTDFHLGDHVVSLRVPVYALSRTGLDYGRLLQEDFQHYLGV